MKIDWKLVKKEHVIKAIKLFENSTEKYPNAKNTFLIFNNKEYPAKHIRGLAYKIATKNEISKNDYSGGKETVKFFKKLNFDTVYRKKLIKNKEKITKKNIKFQNKSKQKLKLNPVDQKNALQKLLQKIYGEIEVEKRFDWLKTPQIDKLPKEYIDIYKNLSLYRNQTKKIKSNYQLLCDIVIEKNKIIIEYDENQHFTKARKITLENYPDNIKLNFSKQKWISYCNKINAKDNNPIDRDEKRAFYDAVRDIEAYKNGYKLIRIKHNDFDWRDKNSIKILKKMIGMNYKDNNKKTKIGRIVVSLNTYYNWKRKIDFIKDFIKNNYKKNKFEFVVTPGGFLDFKIPEKYNNYKNEVTENKYIDKLYKEAEKKIIEYLSNFSNKEINNLATLTDYFTIGIDGFNKDQTKTIELVAIYDTKNKKIIHFTGKFYPVNDQIKELIKVNDLDSHFIKLNGQKLMILGCHDLSVYNPRGRANSRPNSWKSKISLKFRKKAELFEPEIVLQHPHTTDTPKIWKSSWNTLEKELPSVKHYASGINYYNPYGIQRSSIEKVLEKTKKGDVKDYYYK